MVITSFFKKTSTASSFTGVFSALIGFLIGAYLPIGLLPKGLQNMANLIPGSHSTGLFRNVIVNEMIEKLNLTNIEGLATLKQSFGIDLVLFNQPLTKGIMYGYLGISMIVFFIIYLAIEYVKTKQKWIKK
jgi:multidrug/hemolysin transport system permease protein